MELYKWKYLKYFQFLKLQLDRVKKHVVRLYIFVSRMTYTSIAMKILNQII